VAGFQLYVYFIGNRCFGQSPFLTVDVLTVDDLEVDVLVIHVLELDNLGARCHLHT
jgi:hypothetical protein